LGAAQEHRFIEGAGALFGAILLDYFPNARHVAQGSLHRLKLGAHGFFDPFAAVEQALDAVSCQEALADAVAVAEAEARGTGPISRVVAELDRQIASARPDLAITAHFEHDVWLGPEVQVDIRRVVEATRDAGPEDVARSVERIVSALTSEHGALPSWHEVRPRLFPRLVGPSFAKALPTDQDNCALHLEPLLDDLQVAYVLRYDGRARYLRTDELTRWDVSPSQLRATAIDNLEQHSARTRWQRIETEDGPWLVARTGDGLDAARLLLPILHAELMRALEPPSPRLLIGVPHRDGLWASACEPHALARGLAERVRQESLRAPHRIWAQPLVLESPSAYQPWLGP
jgi:uncharacterized protein YtpQ (UPF0354 family)